MTPLKLVVASAVLLSESSGGVAIAQSRPPWTDPSPHGVRLVEVDDGVELEVLDWGGGGRPIPDRIAGAVYLDAAYRYAYYTPTAQENLRDLQGRLRRLDPVLNGPPLPPAELATQI